MHQMALQAIVRGGRGSSWLCGSLIKIKLVINKTLLEEGLAKYDQVNIVNMALREVLAVKHDWKKEKTCLEMEVMQIHTEER